MRKHDIDFNSDEIFSNEGHTEYEKKQRDRYLYDLKAVMTTPQGRRIIRQVVKSSGYLRSPVRENEFKTAVAAGRAAIGAELFLDITAYFPELWIQAQNEYASEIQAERKNNQ